MEVVGESRLASKNRGQEKVNNQIVDLSVQNEENIKKNPKTIFSQPILDLC